MPALPIRCTSGLLAAATIVAVLAGCGSTQPKSAATAADFKHALAGAPPALAALYGAPGRVLDGGPSAFKRQIAKLRGHPVVVNKWASWCGPCRFEFPFFQKQVTKRGKSVAFLAVDGEDSKDGAHSFLAKYPVPYPSFFDPKSKVATVLTRLSSSTGLPNHRNSSATTRVSGTCLTSSLGNRAERKVAIFSSMSNNCL